jgi:hypothetical protein
MSLEERFGPNLRLRAILIYVAAAPLGDDGIVRKRDIRIAERSGRLRDKKLQRDRPCLPVRQDPPPNYVGKHGSATKRHRREAKMIETILR